MKLLEMSVLNFRNISSANIDFTESVNLFCGKNGEGKTNFLESISAVLKLESFRPYCNKSHWCKKNADTFDVPLIINASLVSDRGINYEVKLISENSKKFDTYFNGKKISAPKLKTKFQIVSFSPDDSLLIRGAPELRRKFLDEMFSGLVPSYGEVLSRYESALKNRNALLKKMRDKKDVDLANFKAWTQLLIKEGLELLQLKQEVQPKYISIFKTEVKKIIKNNIDLKFLNNLVLKNAHNDEINSSIVTSTEEYQKILRESYLKDQATGWTHRGPHRDDFEILIDSTSAKFHASQAQARVLAFSLKWAHSEWIYGQMNEKPVILVDDFSSELDATHRKLLSNCIYNTNYQVFFTSTEDSFVDSELISDYNKYQIKNGKVITK